MPVRGGAVLGVSAGEGPLHGQFPVSVMVEE